MSNSMNEQNLPVITHVAPVERDILAITIQAGKIIDGVQIPYEKQPGDEIREEGKKVVHAFRVIRQGKPMGTLVKDRERDKLWVDEKLVGEPLDTEAAEPCEAYTIRSKEDTNYQKGALPVKVYRKSMPVNATEPGLNFVIRHTLYLKLPYPLVEGKAYTLDLGGLNVDKKQLSYHHTPEQLRSEAVHVTQVGYHPRDGVKKAFLSTWMGTGGALEYEEGLTFYLIDESTGEKAFEGKAVLAKAADEADHLEEEKNYSRTHVYQLDFSEMEQPGVYRVYAEGIGCSYPFEIGSKAWEKAFQVAMKGFYHQRSGIELEPPYTDYKRPRPYHPDDGKVVYQSTTTLMDSGNGLNALGTQTNNFDNLVAGKTDEIVPDVWGAYFDAGDWDRRIQHLDATRYQLELLLMHPDYFEGLNLNIPESGNGLADVLNEALWNLDGYRRFQTPEGGVRGGIEAEEHPRLGECSWQDSLTALIYAPGIWSSHVYAGVAARTAYYLKDRRPELAAVYQESALRAMEWAEKEYAAKKDTEPWTPQARSSINRDRNLAAIEMYRLTEDKRWHEIYLETRRDGQRDAAFVYATLPEGLGVDGIKQECISDFIRDADASLAYARGNAFNLTTPNPKRYYGPYSGFFSTPDAVSLIRAHHLTGEKRYLDGVVQACQFGAGANPRNMIYTTGLGYNTPQNLLHHDSRRTGQKVPAGITAYGNFDPSRNMEDWMIKLIHEKGACVPDVAEWPVNEAYFDVYLFPPMTEWTVMQTQGPNAYVWGYLAARE